MTKRFIIEGVDYSSAKKKQQPRKSIFSVSPIRRRNLIWLVGIGFVFAYIAMNGTPHLRFKYVYSDYGRNAFKQYVYHECDYVGWRSQTLFPTDGDCPLILWLKKPKGGN